MQVRAIIGAALELLNMDQVRLEPRIVVPSVFSEHEMAYLVPVIASAASSVHVEYQHAVIIESPSAVPLEASLSSPSSTAATPLVTGLGPSFTKQKKKAGTQGAGAGAGAHSAKVKYIVGCTLGVPRACLRADKILADPAVEFLVIGN